ncbi:MAG: OmcA/MtrC family decaheme c-type cytochrome [Chloroflexi bacterium]|nr:OmcA/MtrC family decaheme c-type cytochrome [Chloroflexota bacterium]
MSMKRVGVLILLLGGLIGGLWLLSSCVAAPAAPAGPPGPGLKMTITKVVIPGDLKPVVTFKLNDNTGAPLKIEDLDKLEIPGAMPARFTIAYLKQDAQTGLTEWLSYVLAPAKGQPYTFKGQQKQPAIAEGTQPNILMDMGGSYKEIGPGSYTYTFATALPRNYDKNATHRVGGEASREERGVVANATLDLVPAGGGVKVTRQVVANESCSRCHDPSLSVHGGLRQDTKLCSTCHTSQNIDLETGNSADLRTMVHKIHRGANLPSVVAGTPYIIKGFPPEPIDFSTVVFPQFGGSTIGDVRNCTTCHGAPPGGMKAEDYAKLAPNADNYKNNPSRAACGSCHDYIDWATGKSTIKGRRDHVGGPQADDKACKTCHQADSGKEFDASVVGAHTIPAQSKQLKGYKVDIVSVTDTAPGQNPTVVFTAKDNAGSAVSRINTLAFNVKGPTTDYTGPITTESANFTNLKTNTDGSFAYTLTRAIPADAKGTWAVGIESSRVEAIVGNEGASANVTVYSYNPVVYVPVTDSTAVPRRQVVSTEKCNTCHKEIAFHGGGRKNTAEYCQLCHNPNNVDVPAQVPATFGGPYSVPPQSINFKLMIHRIHTGEELTRDFTIYRTRGVFNFNEIRFPGDRRNCAKCHVGTSYTLPLPETAASTRAPREFYSPLGPAAAACLGCHDSKSASAHASTMTSSISEACATCHGQGRDFAVEKVHAR